MRFPLLTVVAVLCFTVQSWAAGPYDDVPPGHWAYTSLDYLSEQGVLEGYPDGFFNGERTLTRYEFAQAVARLLDVVGAGGGDDQVLIMAESLRSEFSDQLAELSQSVNEVYGTVNDLDSRLTGLEERSVDNTGAISALEGLVNGIESGPNWQGDLRIRWHFDDYGDTGVRDFRDRVRFRLGYSRQINDAVEVGFRLGTGLPAFSADYTKGHEFAKADIYLDRAYVKYSPAWFGYYTDRDCKPCNPKLDIYAGIFDKNPLMYDPHEMIFDLDVNIHGAGLVYHFNRDFQISTLASVAVDSRTDEYFMDETYLFATEIRHDNLLIDCLDAWVGCYGWQNENSLSKGMFNHNRFYNFDFNSDNTVDGFDRFTPNYNTVKGGLQYTLHGLLPKPLAVYGEYMVNIDSDAEERIAALNPFINPALPYSSADDLGWIVGVQYGAAPRNRGDWFIFADYREVGANAAIDGFTDPGLGGVNRNAFTTYWGWMWADNCLLGISYCLHELNNAFGFLVPSSWDENQSLVIDWNFRF